MQTRAAREASLPAELVLMIIDWCGHFRDKRDGTLAALCRLAKRYQPGAERALYARVRLVELYPGRVTTDVTALDTLIQAPRLRSHVTVVTLYVGPRSAETRAVRSVLENLTNVTVLKLPMVDLVTGGILFANDAVKLRRLEAQSAAIASALVEKHGYAFSTLERLDLYTLSLVGTLRTPAPFPTTGIKAFSLAFAANWASFMSFTSSFRSTLTSLCLRISIDLRDYDLALFPNLQHIGLTANMYGVLYEQEVEDVFAVVRGTGSLPFLRSLTIAGEPPAESQSPFRVLAGPFKIFPLSKYILDAIPSGIQHLSLLTRCVRAEDAAEYLASPLRPSALKTLRVGSEVGLGLKRLMDDEEGPFRRLATDLEEAGVELTTVT